MWTKWIRAAVIGASVLALAACGGVAGRGEMSQNGYRTNSTGFGQGKATGYGIHNNRNLSINRNVAKALERLDGVSSARVVIGESNAYVGLVLNDNAANGTALGGSNARQSDGAESFGSRGNYYGSTDSRAFPLLRGQDKTDNRPSAGRREAGTDGPAPSMYGYTSRGNGGLNGGAEIGSRTGSRRGAGAGMIGGVTMQRSGGPASKGAGQPITGASSLRDVGGSGGGRTDDAATRYMYNGGAYGQLSAYRNNNGLSQQVRARVESVVRSLVPNVRNVYVSADPGFVERLGTYSANGFGGAGGGPIREFNDWVGEMFDTDGDRNRYDMDNGYNQRNRNGVTRQMDNSFDRRNQRHMADPAAGADRAQAGTLGSAGQTKQP